MVNFNNSPFEFQYNGTFCMYSSNLVKVNAAFKQCWPGGAVTCNCMLEINLTPGVFLRINTCNGGTSDVVTNLANLDCLDPIPQTLLFDQTYWNNLNTFHPSFKCATTPSNAIAIRTTLASNADDILILVYKSSNSINSFTLYPAVNYIINSMHKKDKCLCANYSSIKYPVQFTNDIRIVLIFLFNLIFFF